MKKKSVISLICLSLVLFATGCGYNAKGYTLDCNHPTKGSKKILEDAGLSKKEYKEMKDKYESMGYTCE